MKTVGVGACRVCGKSASLYRTHICPECANKPYMAANGHQYTWLTRYDRDCLDSCPCKHQAPEEEPYGTAEDYAGERWDEDY